MAWYIPLLIFGARILDVSIGTVRMILMLSGARYIAALLGFFEVAIWALAVGGVIQYLDNPIALVFYAGGFATGTLVGMAIEDRLAIGFRVIGVINSNPELCVTTHLRAAGYRVTRIEGSGMKGPVEIAYLVLRRGDVRAAVQRIEAIAPDAFLTVERADRATGGAMGPDPRVARFGLGRLGGIRK